jgi:2-polyprenyl-3-methyl-5-hydroxy-6-metoxy-1,4-benzoquinol methylase
MNDTREVLTQDVPECLLCGVRGHAVYSHLVDRYFSVPGQWSLLRCNECRLLWLNPRPRPSESAKLYADYYTHDVQIVDSAARRLRRAAKRSILGARFGYSDIQPESGFWKLAGEALSLLPPLRRKAEREILYLHGRQRGRMLDIGCGDGSFLAQMRDLGWETHGVEPDPKAAQVAREEFGLNVLTGAIGDLEFPDASFDAITMSHVIEHVPDPIEVLRRCHALLRPNGTLVAATPNGSSFGHRFLRAGWRELDPPRHFYIFTAETLGRCAEIAGLRVERLVTSSRNASGIWSTSRQIRRSGMMNAERVGLWLRAEGTIFSFVERVLQSFSSRASCEEITLIARKPS